MTMERIHGPERRWLDARDINEMQARNPPFRCHSFELACADLDIEHRLTELRHARLNDQVERMNRVIKRLPSSATITRCMTSCASTSPTLSLHTMTHGASRPLSGSPLTKRSAKHGPKTP